MAENSGKETEDDCARERSPITSDVLLLNVILRYIINRQTRDCVKAEISRLPASQQSACTGHGTLTWRRRDDIEWCCADRRKSAQKLI